MIAGGTGPLGVSNIVEIIDLLNPAFKCKWNDVRAARAGSIGGIVQNKLLICGGNSQNSFNNGIILRSNEELQLIEGRRYASSVVLNETRLWVCGGKDHKSSSEFISLDQPPENGPKLSFNVSHHCMVQVDSKSIYLIGGSQPYQGLPNVTKYLDN